MIRDTAILLHIVLKRGNFFLTVGALFRKLLACVTCLLQVALAIRQMARIEEYQVQCTMPLAQVYEKGFAFLFYFFFLLFVLCVLDLLLWTGRLIVPGLHDMQLKRYVEIPTVALGQSEGQGQETATVSQLYPRFSEYLGWDGRLLLALTADYCGPLAAADLTNHLWAIFKDAPLPAPAPAVTEPTAVVETTSGTEMKSVPLTDVGGKDEEKATGDQGSAAPQC
nr:hypothetical protein BaRGS_016298 [Batillaria attramentaria]